MNQKIRIKLKSFDHNLVDKSAEKIVKTVKSTGAVVSGPVPLPTHKQIFTVNRSTFVNKKAREQFQLCTFKRILDIYSSTLFRSSLSQDHRRSDETGASFGCRSGDQGLID